MVKPWLVCAAALSFATVGGSWLVATTDIHAQQAAATCSCGCGGTPRPACAHSCKGNPCTGASITHSRIIVGEVVEGQPATFSVVAGNGAVLSGFVVELDGNQKVTTDKQGRGLLTPSSRRVVKAKIDGVTETDVHCVSFDDAAKTESRIPRFATAGNEISVSHGGHFDGRIDNTQAMVGAVTCPILFESPRQAIMRIPAETPAGGSQLRIVDQGRTLERPIRIVKFSMQADRTSLERGESSPGKVIIEGADQILVGGVVRLQNFSTEIIELRLASGGGTNNLEKRIDAGMISNGRIEIPLTIRGRQRGAFSIIGQLFDPQALSMSKCSCGCGGTPRPACAHSCGGNPCTGASVRR